MSDPSLALLRIYFLWELFLFIQDTKQEMGHSSVTTTEIYAKFSLRRLEMDFPSLTKKGKKPKRGYTIGGYNSKDISVNQVIKGVG